MKKILLLVLCVLTAYTTSFSQQDCNGPLTVTIQGSSTADPLDASQDQVTQPTCGPDGSITITVTGGSPDYTFQWQKDGVDFSTEQNLTDIGSGSYTVAITDDTGCSTDLGPIELTEPDPILIASTVNDPSCNVAGVDFNGDIDLNVSGGTGGFTYEWTSDDGSGLETNDEDQTGLSGGTYVVIVTDANGCSATESFTLNAPEELLVSSDKVDPNCHEDNGSPDGSITLNITGGTGDYTYEWTSDDGSGYVTTDENQTDLTGGTYTVVVTDANGCSVELSTTLEEPSAISLALVGEDPTCNADNGTSNGSISITVDGGSGDYTYAWTSDGGTGLDPEGSDQSGLGTGTYTVIVTDANGCSVTDEITLDGPDAIIADATVVEPSCGNDTDGTITIESVDGGSGDYTYNWNTVDGSGVTTTDQNQSDLGVGTYLLTITDSEGCNATFEWVLNGPDAIVVTLDDQQSPDCHPNNGDQNGTIAITATGGTGDLTFAWSSDNDEAVLDQGASTQSGLPGGTYTVTITDANGCSITEEYILIPAAEIDLESTVLEPQCSGGNGGVWLAISPEGDDDAYTYEWSTDDGSGIVQGEKNQNVLSPGTYNVVITNQNGCSVTDEFVIEPTDAISADLNVTSEILCNGDTSGEITVSASGGTGDLEYSIDNGDTFQDSNIFSDLAAGEYTITVKDANGCDDDFDIIIEEPEALTAGTCTEAQDLCNANEGEIKVQAQGGVAPYTVTWSSPDGGTLDQTEGSIDAAGESFTFSGAQGGKSYSFIVTDANGCQIP